MTRLNETIHVDRPPLEVFDYVAEFSNCEQWDPVVTRAVRGDGGPLGAGSNFDVTCALPPGSLDLAYEIVEFERPNKVVLSGRGRFFTVRDTVTVESTERGCTLDYVAEFDWTPALAPFAGGFRGGLERMGRASVQEGLKTALEDAFPAPASSRAPGWFTARGYRGGRRRWKPVSAWMRDKHVVLTGATAGLGRACAEQLATLGAKLTLVVRDPVGGRQLAASLAERTGNEDIALEIADLSLTGAVDNVISNLRKSEQPIDILINNAGALFNSRQLTPEGLERSFALLLLSPYRLARGLHPLLRRAGRARVVNVVSGGMYTQKLRVDDLQSERGEYSGAAAYARCKRALMIVTEQWAREWAADNIVVNAMHPGWADTPGVETALPRFHSLTRPFLRTAAEGADTMTWLAVATEAGKVSGKLFLDRVARPTHILARTRETGREREILRDSLLRWDEQKHDAA